MFMITKNTVARLPAGIEQRETPGRKVYAKQYDAEKVNFHPGARSSSRDPGGSRPVIEKKSS